jgi:leucyl-tRNA synthetase
MTLAPEHELVTQILLQKKEAVQAYIEKKHPNDRKRTYGRCKNDIRSVHCAYAEHPFTKEPFLFG